MSRYIDAEELNKLLCEAKNSILVFNGGICKAQMIVREMPTADVEEVVRCKDCKYCNKIDEYNCWCKGRGFPGQLVTPDDYCSKGRKRNDSL